MALGLAILFHELSSAHLVAQSFRLLENSDGPFLFETLYGREPNTLTRADFDQALEAAEAQYEKAMGVSIKPGQRKQIVWPSSDAKGPFKKAPLAIVYLHGFSAGPLELEPTISDLAQKLEAPLVLTRLAGHGLENGDGAASEEMGRVRARDWWKDANEAMAIGHMLGERVLLMGTSTGAALALSYADMKEIRGSADGPDALILLSPNYEVRAFGSWLLEAALGRWLATVLIGPEREFPAENELHGERWTTRYRAEAVHEMLLVAKRARGVDVAELSIPVLSLYVPGDKVVEPSQIEARAKRFRHPKSETISADWLTRHELASAVFQTEKVPELVERLSLWVRSSVEIQIGTGKAQAEPSHR